MAGIGLCGILSFLLTMAAYPGVPLLTRDTFSYLSFSPLNIHRLSNLRMAPHPGQWFHSKHPDHSGGAFHRLSSRSGLCGLRVVPCRRRDCSGAASVWVF